MSISSSSSLKPALLSLTLLLALLLLLLSQTHHHLLFISSFFLLSLPTLYFLSRPRPIYLLDYACFKPTPACRVPFSAFMEHARLMPFFDDRTVRFQMRILERSGLGEETCLPHASHYIPPIPSLPSSIEESHTVFFSAIDHLFKVTSIISL